MMCNELVVSISIVNTKRTITYLDVCLDLLSKICLNTEAKEHSQRNFWIFGF